MSDAADAGRGAPPGRPVLEVRDLKVYYDTPAGVVKAVDGVTFDLAPGERLGLVGESGSGKTTMAMALMRLTKPPGHVAGGSVRLDGRDVLALDEEQMRGVRLAELALVPQGAMNSLNPVLRVRDQIIDGLVDHGGAADRASHLPRVYELLESVGLQRNVAMMYAHELSGGMKQRVALAIATALGPKVILADEPTSALDVVVQRQIMDTLGRLQEGLHAAVILVGHDMGLMAQFADRIGVMYAGELVECGPVPEVFAAPLHPYTRLLIESLPTLRAKRDLVGIPGLPPRLLELPDGCVFHPRCPSAMAHCRAAVPRYEEVRPERWTRCHLYDPQAAGAGAPP